MIKNFKTIKSKVRDVLKDYPEIIGQPYENIWKKIGQRYPELKAKKTTTERCYRKLKSDAQKGLDEDIEIPIDVELRTRKQEEIMHDIHHWDGMSSDFDSNQKTLMDGIEK